MVNVSSIIYSPKGPPPEDGAKEIVSGGRTFILKGDLWWDGDTGWRWVAETWVIASYPEIPKPEKGNEAGLRTIFPSL
jgi:hypothetical protein